MIQGAETTGGSAMQSKLIDQISLMEADPVFWLTTVASAML